MKKILIVDDEEIIIEYLAYELSFEGFHVTAKISGNDAIEELKKQNFDIILSDIRMKNGSGFDLLNFVNSNNIDLDFYLMSADTSIEPEEMNLLKIKGYFVKPLDFDYIIKVLSHE